MAQNKEQQKKLLIEIMEADNRNGLYKQQTAVEWMVIELNQKIDFIPIDKWDMIRDIVQQAKQMEKEQIMKAVDRGFDEGCKHPEDVTLKDAEQYYNETYGKP